MPDPFHPGDFGDLIERFDHVAVATHDIRGLLPLIDLLEGELRNGGDNHRDGFRYVQFFLPAAGKVELLQPLDPEDTTNFLVRFLRDKGPGVHHLTFKVTDLLAAVARARELGFEVVGVNADHEYWKEAFVHPRSSHGVLVQLAQWRDRPPPGISIADVLGPAG